MDLPHRNLLDSAVLTSLSVLIVQEFIVSTTRLVLTDLQLRYQKEDVALMFPSALTAPQ